MYSHLSHVSIVPQRHRLYISNEGKKTFFNNLKFRILLKSIVLMLFHRIKMYLYIYTITNQLCTAWFLSDYTMI